MKDADAHRQQLDKREEANSMQPVTLQILMQAFKRQCSMLRYAHTKLLQLDVQLPTQMLRAQGKREDKTPAAAAAAGAAAFLSQQVMTKTRTAADRLSACRNIGQQHTRGNAPPTALSSI